MDKVLLNFAIMFCLKQVAKFGTVTDFHKIKDEVDPVARDWMPGDWFDDEAVAVVNEAIDAFAFVCKDTADLQNLVTKLIAGDWPGALVVLKDIVSKVHPTTPMQIDLKECVMGLAA